MDREISPPEACRLRVYTPIREPTSSQSDLLDNKAIAQSELVVQSSAPVRPRHGGRCLREKVRKPLSRQSCTASVLRSCSYTLAGRLPSSRPAPAYLPYA